LNNWIQLASGGGYDFDTAELFGPFSVEDDLAWPLTCPRYTKHTRRGVVWTVALHSVACARAIISMTGQLTAGAAGLLHDMHEAVIGDITTPVARHVDYARVKALKSQVDAAICEKLGIPTKCRPGCSHHTGYVDLADQAALQIERTLFCAPEPRQWTVPRAGIAWERALYKEIIRLQDNYGDMSDGGFAAFMEEYHRLVKE